MFKEKDSMKAMMHFKENNKGKHMKKTILFCMVLAGLCGCRKEQEELPASLSPSPDITEVAEQEEIPIDAEHFSDEIFREYISGMYDLDKNGALSQREREAVKEIIWSRTDIPRDNFTFDYRDMNGAVLDGLEYFPKLEDLTVEDADCVILKNHPSIQGFGISEGRVETVMIENCPALEKIGVVEFYGWNRTVEGYLTAGGNLTVKNCENLRIFNAGTAKFGTLIFEETPNLVAYFDVVGVENFSMDANAVINFDDATLQRILGEEIYKLTEDGKLSFGLNECIHWTNVDENSMVAKEQFSFPLVTEEEFTYLDVEISEKEEENVPEQEEKAWEASVIQKEIKWGSWGPEKYTIYAEEKPERAQFILRPIGGVDDVLLLEYSPNKGISFYPWWRLEVVYRDGENEEVLGTVYHKQFWKIEPDGTISRYKYDADYEPENDYWKETHMYRASIDLGEDPGWYSR